MWAWIPFKKKNVFGSYGHMGLDSTQEKIKWVWILTILHNLVYFSCNLLGGCIWCNQVNLCNSAIKTQEWRREDFVLKTSIFKTTLPPIPRFFEGPPIFIHVSWLHSNTRYVHLLRWCLVPHEYKSH